MRIAVPDLISSSYFPCIAACALGLFREQGFDLELVHVSPVEKCAAALRDGEVDFIGASAHAPLTAFAEGAGARLVCAQSQGLYWLLVMRAELSIARGDLAALRGRRIAAVPFVAASLHRILAAAGIDAKAEGIAIVSPPGAAGAGVNFGVAAARALAAGEIDGFFANAMGAEIAVRDGVGSVVLDVRRGDGPPECFGYTMPAVATTERLIASRPDVAAGVVRAINRAHALLRADPGQAAVAAASLFPHYEASLIADLVRRDLPYYATVITPAFVRTMASYAHSVGLLRAGDIAFERVAAAGLAPYWSEAAAGAVT